MVGIVVVVSNRLGRYTTPVLLAVLYMGTLEKQK